MSSAGRTSIPERVGRYLVMRAESTPDQPDWDVYLGMDPDREREVRLWIPSAKAGLDRPSLERIVHDARSATSVSHPNLCATIEAGQGDKGQLFVAVRYLDGKPLSDYLGPNRQMPIEQVARFVRKLADALRTCHKQKLAHLDVKPANVLIDKQREPFLTNLGMTPAGLNTKTRSEQARRTKSSAYLAPEFHAEHDGQVGPASGRLQPGSHPV